MLNYTSIGQQCCMETKSGKQCRLPASTIAGGLASCPYHIGQAVKLFRKVNFTGFEEVKNQAIKESSVY